MAWGAVMRSMPLPENEMTRKLAAFYSIMLSALLNTYLVFWHIKYVFCTYRIEELLMRHRCSTTN